jgi:hypothetical protein
MLVFEYLEKFHSTKLVKIYFFYKPGNGGGGGGMYSDSGKSKTQAYSVIATSGLSSSERNKNQTLSIDKTQLKN